MLKKLIVAALATAATVQAISHITSSGLDVGEFVPAYDPHHVTGPDAGTDTCPVCKYGSRPAVQVWVNGDDAKNVRAIAGVVSQMVEAKKASELKALIVWVADKADKPTLETRLAKLAEDAKYKDIALAWLSKDNEAVDSYKMNLDKSIRNTVLVYKNRKVTSKFVNLAAQDPKLTELRSAIEQAVSGPQ